MKKLFVYLGIMLLAVGMTACGSRGKDNVSTESADRSEAGGTTAESAGTGETGTSESMENTEGMDDTAGWSKDMETIKEAVVKVLGENYWPNSQILPEMLESNFGITSDMYDDYMGEMPMISVNIDTLLIIKAKDGKVDEVEQALNAYRDKLVEDTVQYPMNLGKIQASRIETFGNFVCFVQLGADTSEVSESGDEEVIRHCQEQNELALEVIGQSVPK